MHVTPNLGKTPAPAERAFNLPQLIRMARRRLRLMSAVFLLIVAMAAAVTMSMRPTFTADVHLMIDKPSQELLARETPTAADTVLDASVVETEVEVLRSTALAESVIAKLGLDRDPEFNSALAPPDLKTRLRQSLSRVKPASVPREDAPKSPVVDAVLDRLKVSRVGTSYLVNLAFTSHDPDKAARIANAFAADYLRSQLEAKFDASREGNAWLHSRIGEMRQRVVDAETALQRYKIENNLLSAQGATLAEQEISTLDQQVALTRAQQAEAQARLGTAMSQLASGSKGDDVGEALSSPVVQQLRQQRALTSQRVANLQSRYGDRHPDLLKAKHELADIDSQIQGEIQRVVSNLQAQEAVARQRTVSIEDSASRSRQDLAQTNRSMVRLNELQRDADAERTLYESFLSKFKEMSAEAGLARSDAHVVSLARAPSFPSAPRKGLNIAFGMVLGLAAAVTAALIAEMFDNGVADIEVVERELNVNYIGSIPSLRSIVTTDDPLCRRPIDHIVAKPVSSFAESFRSLNAAIGFSRLGAKPKVLAVTSSLPGEGKTTTSVALARSAAMSGLRAVVVDCDLRQRAVNQLLQVEPTVGLVEVLNGEATLDEALMLDAASGAMVLPLVRPHYTPQDMFSSEQMARMIEELRRRFDLIVLDTAPVILVTETRMIVRHADVVLLLVYWRKTRRSLVRTSLRLLDAAGATVAGVALTRVDVRQAASVDPDDPSAYYRAYRKYYTAPERPAGRRPAAKAPAAGMER
ncbi:polysaccharide biosynthesis tyrosine autokinase [Phenylobacterium sp.]|uniref:GumC family protein n=1 Tax=Phenylobacterium sp. TaxID=1871053 RepID=UPI002F42AA30